MRFKNIVVGAGFAGAILARRIAEEKNEEVLVVEKKNHIGGHAYDEYNEHGVLVHRYGPHVFHTEEKKVWQWLSRFTTWYMYQHRVLAYVDGMLIPMPISIETVNSLTNLNLSTNQFENWLEINRKKLDQINSSADIVLANAGELIYHKFFKNYTLKQWGISAENLRPSVIKRIPFRNNRDTRYFSDCFQGVPECGYSAMFREILNHKNIKLLLQTQWNELPELSFNTLYYTGPIDEYYKYVYGRLKYRSVRFEYKTFFDRDYFQSVGTVNYPNDYDFTRITEFKYFTGQKIHNKTTVCYEFSSADGEPYYFVPELENEEVSEKYKLLADNEKKVHFLGRLAESKYYNMDQVAKVALEYDLTK